MAKKIIEEKNSLRGTRVLVTGGAGFLGVRVIRALERAGARVDVLAGDVRGIWKEKKRCDLVCHLASINKAETKKEIAEMFDVNVGGTLEVLRFCSNVGARCVMASSSAVYTPRRKKAKLVEEVAPTPVSPYGLSKFVAESLTAAFSVRGVPVTVLRIFNMYGPGQKETFLIPYLVGKLRAGKPITLKTPNAVRDFIHVDDVVRALTLSCALADSDWLTLNVGTGHGSSVKEIVTKLARFLKTKPILERGAAVDRRPDYVVADIGAAQKILGWTPAVSIDEGLKSVLASPCPVGGK